MEAFSQVFSILSKHRILKCHSCSTAVPPQAVSNHLRDQHQQLPKKQRDIISSYVEGLTDLARAHSQVIYPHPSDPPVIGFQRYYDGLRCDAPTQDGALCAYICRTRAGIQHHCKTRHGWKNVQRQGGHSVLKQTDPPNKLWTTGITCQTFFKQPGWRKYFELTLAERDDTSSEPQRTKAGFFTSQHEDIGTTQQDAEDAANYTEGFDRHHSAVVPWLQTTGIAGHIQGLRKDQIRSAVALPDAETEPTLQVIAEAMQQVLQVAHSWCFDGPECMLSWPSRIALSQFQGPRSEAKRKMTAFAPHKRPNSLKKYFALALRFLAYLYRITRGVSSHFDVHDGSQAPETVVRLTVGQQRAWHTLLQTASRQEISGDVDGADDSRSESETSDSEARDGAIQDPPLQHQLVNLWMLLISHETAAQRYSSPLVSFCAMLSMQPTTGTWMRPGDFSSDLSKLIWIVQLLIFYHSAQQERCGHGRTLTLIQECCAVYLHQANETPMGEILRWRLLLFHVRDHTVSDQQAGWNEAEDEVTYEGTSLRMDHIPTLLKSEYQHCHHVLYDELMLQAIGFQHMHAPALRDRSDVHTVHWSFKDHLGNADLLRGTDRFLLYVIERSEHLSRLFVSEQASAAGGWAWRPSAIATFERHVQVFLARLCVLIHVSSGQPIREPEFFSMMWRNTQRVRQITIRHDRVMIHTQYGKQQQQQGLYQDSVRFLPQPIGTLLLDYLVFVLPLRERFLRQSSPQALLSPLLWERGGTVWSEGRLSACLEAACVRAAVPRLHVSNWRQITVAIVKTKFAGDAICFDLEDGNGHGEEIEADIEAMTEQRNHKTRTVNRAYANQASSSSTFANVYDGLIRKGLRASQLWHAFWGLEIVFANKKRKVPGETEATMTKRIARGIYKPRSPWSAPALLTEMRRLYGRGEMQWKTMEQEQALATIMLWREQVVAILPTGAGKSMLFMLPCTLPDAGTTILVVPLVALRADLIRRVRELQINYLEWTPGERREASLVFVSVEAACSPDFEQYAKSLVVQQALDRIVVDECHLTVVAAEYRPKLTDLAHLRSFRTQFVYLTATLPPTMQADFEERNFLHRPTVIRASTNRPNILYMVRKAKLGHGSLLEQSAAEARAAWQKSGVCDQVHDKIILYVRTRDEATTLSGLLASGSYTAESGSTIEKQHILEQWVSRPDQPFIVATSALAEGFDYAHVRLVINVNEPESLVMFAQESGRAGRDGQKAYSLVILASTWQPQYDGQPNMTTPSSRYDNGLRKEQDRHSVHQYLRGEQCYRTSLTEYLDDAEHRRWCMPEDVPCDICQSCHEEPISPKQTEPTSTARTGLDLIQQDKLRAQSELAEYRSRLSAVRGTCLLCRALDEPWNHALNSCPRRHQLFHERSQVQQRHAAAGKSWLRPYTGCFWCLNPQSICRRAEESSQGGKQACENADVVLPLCYGVYLSLQGPQWLRRQFGRPFNTADAYFDWLGEETRFGGGAAIQAVRVAAEALYHLEAVPGAF